MSATGEEEKKRRREEEAEGLKTEEEVKEDMAMIAVCSSPSLALMQGLSCVCVCGIINDYSRVERWDRLVKAGPCSSVNAYRGGKGKARAANASSHVGSSRTRVQCHRRERAWAWAWTWTCHSAALALLPFCLFSDLFKKAGCVVTVTCSTLNLYCSVA